MPRLLRIVIGVGLWLLALVGGWFAAKSLGLSRTWLVLGAALACLSLILLLHHLTMARHPDPRLTGTFDADHTWEDAFGGFTAAAPPPEPHPTHQADLSTLSEAATEGLVVGPFRLLREIPAQEFDAFDQLWFHLHPLVRFWHVERTPQDAPKASQEPSATDSPKTRLVMLFPDEGDEEIFAQFAQAGTQSTWLEPYHYWEHVEPGEWEGTPYLVQHVEPSLTLQQLNQRQRALPPEEQGLAPAHVMLVLLTLCHGLERMYAQCHAAGHEIGALNTIYPDSIACSHKGIALLKNWYARPLYRLRERVAGILMRLELRYLYMAPEALLSDEKKTMAADIYGLGMLMWYLFTGLHAIRGDSEFDCLRKIRDNELPDLTEARPDLPTAFHAVYRKATAADPQARFASFAALRQELRTLCAQHDLHPDPNALAQALGFSPLKDDPQRTKLLQTWSQHFEDALFE